MKLASALKTVYDRRFKAFRENIISVGVFTDATYGDKYNKKVKDIAIINEFGLGDVPERSFLRAPLHANRSKLMNASRRAARAGDLRILGEEAVRIIQKAIREGVDPENAPSTIARKGSSTPLMDSQLLYDSIEYRIVPR